jgi:hypothetical protein
MYIKIQKGKSNETDMMRLEELISVIKGQKRISLSYLNELSLKVNHQTDLNFWHKETRIQETTSKIIINGLNEKITENELRVHFGNKLKFIKHFSFNFPHLYFLIVKVSLVKLLSWF